MIARLPRAAALLAALASLAIPGCYGNIQMAGNGPLVKGSGVLKTEERPVADFTAVSLTGIGRVVVKQTGREALTVTADDNLLEHIETAVVDGTLRLGVRDGVSIQTTKALEFVIEAKALDAVKASGVGTVELEDIDAKKLTITLSGTGNVSASGRAEELAVTVSGVGGFRGEGLRARKAVVRNSGVGNSVVNASDELDATVSGVGSVDYVGSPSVRQSVSGVGRVKQR